jgi:hypothetical protein
MGAGEEGRFWKQVHDAQWMDGSGKWWEKKERRNKGTIYRFTASPVTFTCQTLKKVVLYIPL